jgi:hypothetical protein
VKFSASSRNTSTPPFLMQVFLARYVELYWDSGRSLVVKLERRPEIPPCIAGKFGVKRPKLPHIEEEGEE